MKTMREYLDQNPEYDLFVYAGEPVYRIYDSFLLSHLDEELIAVYEIPEHRGNGSRNHNQTRTHYQCYGCKRLLRNDLFNSSKSVVLSNGMPAYCKKCTAVKNKERYDGKPEILSNGRLLVWNYIAPECSVCGYKKHSAAIEMHHLSDKKGNINLLVGKYVASPLLRNAEILLKECKKCVPICSNCHREHHHGVPFPEMKPRKYSLVELMAILLH